MLPALINGLPETNGIVLSELKGPTIFIPEMLPGPDGVESSTAERVTQFLNHAVRQCLNVGDGTEQIEGLPFPCQVYVPDFGMTDGISEPLRLTKGWWLSNVLSVRSMDGTYALLSLSICAARRPDLVANFMCGTPEVVINGHRFGPMPLGELSLTLMALCMPEHAKMVLSPFGVDVLDLDGKSVLK